MLEVAIPGWNTLRLAYLVLDVNGTLACEGALLPGVRERLDQLRPKLALHLLTADTFGRLDALLADLQVEGTRLAPDDQPEQKAAFVRKLGAEMVAAIGNGANDAAMLRASALGIAVLGPEGLARDASDAADVLAPSITAALDLLIAPTRLVATLRR